MKLEKVYAVEFMEYTNCLCDTVSDYQGDNYAGLDSMPKINYLNVGKGFLAKESDLYKYQKYGRGFKNLNFVGYIEVDEENLHDK